LGLEYEYELQIGMEELTEISATVQARLKKAGLDEEATFHLQLEAQY
jgi:hypothetical protein